MYLENSATLSAVITMPQPITGRDVFNTRCRAFAARFAGDDLP